MDCAGVVDAYRAGHLLRGNWVHDAVIAVAVAVAVVAGRLCCCGSGLGRVHVEKEAVAPNVEGVSIAEGKRLAKALAGHSALRVSMVVASVDVERWVKRAPRTFR